MKAGICGTVLVLTLGAGVAMTQASAQAGKARAGAAEVAPIALRACPAALPSYANSTTTCSAAVISLACKPGWFDANGVILDGCELQLDGVPNSYAAAKQLGVLACGSKQSLSGNTAPLGADDWYQFVVPPGCQATLTLTGSALVSYDVIMGESAPPATTANSKLTGSRSFSAAAAQKVTVRVWSPTIVTYTLTVVAK